MEGKEIVLCELNHTLIKKKIIEFGNFSTNPLEGTECDIEISDIDIQRKSQSYNSEEESLLLSKNFNGKWVVGDASSYIDIDLERCLQHMFLHEMSIISISYLDKDNICCLNISCKIKVLNVRSTEELFCNWHWAKKITHAKQYKDVGKQLAHKNLIMEAFSKFSKALKFLLTVDKQDLEGVSEVDNCEITNLKLDLYNNLAFCQLQYQEYQAVITLCNKALELKKDSTKAFYRRGCALMGLSDWEAAYSDMCQVLASDPNNAAAKCKAAQLKQKVFHMNEAYKKVIRNMFV